MKIRLHPVGVEIEGDSNRSLLQLCHDNKVELKSLCKGVPSCAECRIKILAGESNVIPPNKAELSLIGTSYYIDGRRLACQIRCFGDISVDITDHLKEDDNTSKKLRGYRAPPGQSRESKAVQGTMVLQEPAAPVENTGGGRRGAKGNAPGGRANDRGERGANDRGRQVKHPGDELVAGTEHPEPLETADLDGSGDEGVIDPLHAGGDIYAGDEADTSEAITRRLDSQSETDDDHDDDYEDEDGDDDSAPATPPSRGSGGGGGGQNRGSGGGQQRQGGPQARGGGAGGGRGGQGRGGQPGQPRPEGQGAAGSGAGGPGGEGGGQKRRRRRGGRGRRGGGGGGQGSGGGPGGSGGRGPSGG